MSNSRIKGITVSFDGDVTSLGKALKDIETKGKSLSSELKSINSLLRLDPTNVELLSQKQKVLADALSSTKSKLDALREAERQVQAQFERGEVSEEQVRALQREIIATEKKMDGYKKASKETADAIDKVGKQADGTADDLGNMGKEAKSAEKASDDLGDTLDTRLGNGLKAVIALLGAASAALVGLTESSRDYRTAQGRLTTGFDEQGFSAETAKKTYKELQSVLGETDKSVEAANHLANLAKNEQDLTAWTTILTGAFAKFPDSLPVEALAETSAETVKTGKLTGALTDAINWAAAAGETFGIKMKETTEENEAFNQKVAEATNAEEFFQIALDECSTEQERQKLITETLTELYGPLAEKYRETNKEVIRANEVNDAWNETLANTGSEIEPVLTDLKAFGVSVLEEMQAPIQSLVGWIKDKFLPALHNTANWVRSNAPVIKGVLVGATAAMVAYKVATLAATVAHTGLIASIKATAAAQAALNLVQSASPFALVASAVVGVTTALAVYSSSTQNAWTETKHLTDEELALIDASHKAAQAFKDQQAANDESAGSMLSHMDYVNDLANELQTLADANGNVQEKDQARVQFIKNEMKNALGIEFEIIDGTIQKYDELKGSIDKAMESKKANAMLDIYEEDWKKAIVEKDKAYESLILAEKDYLEQQALTAAKEKEWHDTELALQADLEAARAAGNDRDMIRISNQISAKATAWRDEKKQLDEKKAKYDDAQNNYKNYVDTIANYEDAQQAVLEGNYNKAVDLLTKKGLAYNAYSEDVDSATADVLNTLRQEAIDAGLEAERIKENFEKGVEGFTQEMVDEAEQGYKDAMAKFDSAYKDAEGVGQDIGSGLSNGLMSMFGAIASTVSTVVGGIEAVARDTADCHSPSRKMVAFGEDMGEGPIVGIRNKTPAMLQEAQAQIRALMGVYENAGGPTAIAIQRNANVMHAQQQVQQQAQANATAASFGIKLDEILTVLRNGQVLTIDGKTFVGATANQMDRTLGQNRALSARGAM